MMVSFVLSFFPRDVLDEILNLIESVSEDFPSYSCILINRQLGALLDHVPFARHTLLLEPFTKYPMSQLYTANEPNVVPPNVTTSPLSIPSRVPQSVKQQNKHGFVNEKLNQSISYQKWIRSYLNQIAFSKYFL